MSTPKGIPVYQIPNKGNRNKVISVLKTGTKWVDFVPVYFYQLTGKGVADAESSAFRNHVR